MPARRQRARGEPTVTPMSGAMRTLRQLQQAMEGLYTEFYQDDWKNRPTYMPLINAWKTADGFVVEVALPGVKREDVKVALDRDVLTLSGQMDDRTTVEEDAFALRELRFGSFSRRIQLPFEAQPSRVTAHLQDGILRITLVPRKQGRRSIRVDGGKS